MTSNPLRQKMRTLLDTFDSLSRQGGVVERDLLMLALYGKLDAEEAEDLIDHLLKEGILHSPRPGVLQKPSDT